MVGAGLIAGPLVRRVHNLFTAPVVKRAVEREGQWTSLSVGAALALAWYYRSVPAAAGSGLSAGRGQGPGT